MATIAYVRRFNGTSDEIQLATTDYNGSTFGPFTVATICRRVTDATGYKGYWSIASDVEFGLTDGELFAWVDPTTRTGPADTMDSADGWNLVAVTKGSGTVVPRWHQYRYSDTTWVVNHVDDDGTLADKSITAGQAWLGTFNGTSEWYEGDIAVVGVWKGTALSDANIETLTDDIASWEALSPTGLWLLDQASVATPLTDRVGAGDQTAINGTTVVSSPGLAFDVGGDVGRTYKRLYGPAQLTGSATDLYTCPASTITRTLHIHASNPSGSPVDANLSIGTDAAGTRVWDDKEIPADDVEDVFDPYELAAGEKIQGWASTAGTVVVTITGYEDPV